MSDLKIHLVIMLLVRLATAATAGERVILDTDLGNDTEDALALACALSDPGIDLRAITTSGESAEDRAWMVGRLLTATGNAQIPVAWGRSPQPRGGVGPEIQYRQHASVVWNRTLKPSTQTAVELMQSQLKAGNVSIVATGPLTNVARLLEHADVRKSIKQIICGDRHADSKAFFKVVASGVPLVIVPRLAALDLSSEDRQKLFSIGTPLVMQIQCLDQLTVGNPANWSLALAVTATKGEVGKPIPKRVEVRGNGMLRDVPGTANVQWLPVSDPKRLAAERLEQITSYGETTLPDPPGNRAQFVLRTGLPLRVHAFEDYETDIERRWWLSGKLETEDVPSGSHRACRGVLTQDFDAKMGNTRTMYTGVVFNPVPGPPMGPNTRLSFRYKLTRTDTIRIQLFSLSNGYHRYLSLSGLPRGHWEQGTVDMTQMRRPDGSGGALAENERIDDVQFYVDPRADVLIDDVVLYEPAPEGEKRPYPKRFLFTGWFDTGKQGEEWPGAYEIVPHAKPRTWKAAKAIANDRGRPWIRLSLRGARQLDERVRLRFAYLLNGPQSLQVTLVNSKTGKAHRLEVTKLKTGAWDEMSLEFKIPGGAKLSANELHLVAGEGAELQIDDLLLYVPGE